MYFIRICGSDGRPLFWEILDPPLSFLHYKVEKEYLEDPGIDPGTSHMLSERSTIWASPDIAYTL